MVALAMVALISVLCFRLGAGKHSDKFNTAATIIFSLFALWLWGLKLLDGFDVEWDLPLALCDVIFLFCLTCFIKPYPLLITWVTYWGLGGTLQAMITPDVMTAFPSSEFILFFIGHALVVWAVFFLLGRNPHQNLAGFAGLKTAFLGLLGYTVIIGSFDLIFNLNYGYLLHKPQGASVLDFLGDWPIYVFAGLGIGLVIFSVLAVALKLLPIPESEVEAP